MKYLFFSLLPLLLVCCNGGSESEIRAFIPGTYIRPFAHEFARGTDTLRIRRLEGDFYEILLTSGFVRIREGVETAPVFKQERMVGLYDEKEGVIDEPIRLRRFSFDPGGNQLFFGATPYRKTK